MKKKTLKQFAVIVMTLALATQPVIAGAQELDVSAENPESAEDFSDVEAEETETDVAEPEDFGEDESLEIFEEQPDEENAGNEAEEINITDDFSDSETDEMQMKPSHQIELEEPEFDPLSSLLSSAVFS